MLVARIITLVETFAKIVCSSELSLTPSSGEDSSSAPEPHGSDFQIRHDSSTRKAHPDYAFNELSIPYRIAVSVIAASIAALILTAPLLKTFDIRGYEPLQIMYKFSASPNPAALIYFTFCMLCSISIHQHLPHLKFGRIAVYIVTWWLFCGIIISGFMAGLYYVQYSFAAYLVLLIVE
ncbi:hypothetical protein E8E11_004394 [Didymella keratinophila]|nr:hypothetical protein E8E11_004394 [Didymella keratinophila]